MATVTADAYVQRVKCVHCGQQRLHPVAPCGCGSREWKSVKPGEGDLQAIQAEIVDAAEGLDRLFQTGRMLRADDPAITRLRQACRAHALAKIGILVQ